MTPTFFAITIFAAWRLWSLFAHDTLTRPLRRRLHHRIRDWVECYRCGGWWIAAGVSVLSYTVFIEQPTTWVHWVAIGLIAFAVNGVMVAVIGLWRTIKETYIDYISYARNLPSPGPDLSTRTMERHHNVK